MGAACKKSKVKDPKRDAARELEEKEKKEKEAQKNAEEEAAKLEEDKRLEEEEAAERARLEEEKRRAEEEEEARRKAEEEEAARLKALEEEAQRLKDLEEAERKAREEAEEAERAAKAAQEAEEKASIPPPSLAVPPEPTQLDQDEMTPHEKYQKLASDQDMDTASEATLSTQATGAVQQPQECVKETKPSPPPQQVKVTAAPMSARSVTPCDMTAVDQTAKLVSKSCGCDMGDGHDENKCPICKNMDLSDAPLLN